MNKYYIPIGGSCFFGTTLRENNNPALPFDFLRTKFSFVIECIENNFKNFLPENTNPDLLIETPCENTYIYNLNTHCFYHHDLRLDNVRDSFLRRIERFKKILFSDDEIFFLRSVSSKEIKDELTLIPKFYKVIRDINPSISFKLFLVGHRPDEDINRITIEKYDEYTKVFTVGNKPTIIENNVNFDINIQPSYNIIFNYIKTGLLPNNIKLYYIEENESINIDKYNYNSFSLDYYP